MGPAEGALPSAPSFFGGSMSATDTLDRLLEVQELDVEIAEKEERLEELPKRRDEVSAEIRALDEERSAHEKAMEKARVERRTKETELDARREQLERYESQLNDVKTNVAYSALLTEIQGTKREMSDLEDEILELMEQIEAHEERLEEIAGELEQKRAEASDELEALDREEAELEEAVGDLDHKRDRLAEQVDGTLLHMYGRLRRARRFPALVPLRGHACGACHNRLPPQVVQEVAHRGELHVCEACGVLVYGPGSPQEEDAAEETPAEAGA